MQKIDNAIERKEQKSKNYQKYLNNGLYIFSHCHNLPKHLLEEYFNNHPLTDSFYQHIYINCVSHVYHYQCIDNTFKRINYHYSELSKMNHIALEFEKHCKKTRRKIIL